MSRTHSAKRRFPLFYTILALVVIAGVIAVVIGLGKVKDFLRVYEEALPKYTAEGICDAYFRHPDYELIFSLTGATLSPYESGEEMRASVEAWKGTEPVTWRPVTGSVSGELLRYAVHAGDRPLGVFTLKQSGETEKYHRPLYQLDSVEYTYRHEALDARITTPLGVQLRVNGIPLDESRRDASRDMATTSCAYMPEGVRGLIIGTYCLSGFTNPPTLTATYPDGTVIPLLPLEGDGSAEHPLRYEATVRYNEPLALTYREPLLDFCRKYAAYMQSDGGFAAFASYLDKNSLLYDQIRTTEVYFVWDHDGYDIEDAEATDFYVYDDNTFSARVRYTHVLHKAGMEDYRDYTDMTLYLRRVGDTYLIYQMENH